VLALIFVLQIADFSSEVSGMITIESTLIKDNIQVKTWQISFSLSNFVTEIYCKGYG